MELMEISWQVDLPLYSDEFKSFEEFELKVMADARKRLPDSESTWTLKSFNLNPCTYYDVEEFSVFLTRFETEAEATARLEKQRIAKEKRSAAAKAARITKLNEEYKMFQKLKKKFENGPQ